MPHTTTHRQTPLHFLYTHIISMSDSDSDQESNVRPEFPVPRVKAPVRELKLSNKLEVGNDPSLLPYAGVAGSQKEFKKFCKSQVLLPAPWFMHRITQHQCKPYQPFNKHIYDIATGETPCDLMHIVPASFNPTSTTSTYYFPCKCTDITCYTPPQRLTLDLRLDLSESKACFLDVRDEKESTKAWVWDVNSQYAATKNLNSVSALYIFPVPARSTVYRGPPTRKRKKGLRLSDRKYSWKKQSACPKK